MDTTPPLILNLITTKEAGRLSGYTSDYLARLVRSGKIEGRRMGHGWLIDHESLQRFVSQQKIEKEKYTQELSRTREVEYRASRNHGDRVEKMKTSDLYNGASMWSARFAAFSVAFAVVASGALAAQTFATLELPRASRDVVTTALSDSGETIVRASHAVIDAEVRFAYALAGVAPESARVAVTTIGSVGDTLARVASLTPTRAAVLYTQMTSAPNLIPHASLLATTLNASALSASEQAALTFYNEVNNFFRGVGSQLAFLLSPTSSVTLETNSFPDDTLTIAPSVLPAPVVVATSTLSAPPRPVQVTNSAPRISNSYPTYTTVVQGVSQDMLNQSIESLKVSLLGSVSSLIRPVVVQTATNASTIQQVSRIQDLSDLIVRNGDFRGGSLSNGVSVSATTGSFTTLSSTGTTTLGVTTVNGELVNTATSTFATAGGNVGIGTSTPNWLLQVAGTRPSLALSDTSAGTNLKHWLLSSMGGDLYIGTSTDLYATSTPAALAITNAGKIGTGTSTPWGKLGVEMDTTNPAFVVSNQGSTTPAFYIGGVNQDGRVGIGSSTPMERLTVTGNIANLTSSAFNPTIKGTATTAATPRIVTVSGRYAYVGGDANTLEVFDVSTSSPSRVGSVSAGSAINDMVVSGRYAYVRTAVGLKIFDVSNPSSPVLLSTTAGFGSGYFLTVSGRYAYLTEYIGGKLHVVDISNPASPVIVSSTNATSGTFLYPIFVSGRYAYIAEYTDNQFEIYDISNPAAPSFVSVTSTGVGGTALDVYVSGKYAYVLANGLKIYDISNPALPVLLGTGSYSVGGGDQVFVSGRYAYVTNYATASTLTIFDVADPTAPVNVGSVSTGNLTTSLFVSGRYAYVTNYTDNNLKIIDISGVETTSAMVHSLEAGNLQVRNDIFAQGQLQVTGGVNVGTGGIFSAGPLSVGIASTTQTNPTSAFFQGSVGVSTSSPWGKFSIEMDTANPSFVVSNSGSTTPAFYIGGVNQDGRVGIGTTSPSATLAVNGTFYVSDYVTFTSTVDYFNTSIGYLTGTAGRGNSAFGHRALTAVNSSGTFNTAIGTYSLTANTTGSRNTAVGMFALGTNISAYSNTAVGYSAAFNTTGYYNTAVGDEALTTNTTGTESTAVGNGALRSSTGNYNTALGSGALYTLGSGTENTGLGWQAAFYTTGSSNAVVGAQAGFGTAASTFANTTLLGRKSGFALTTGSNNILLGYQAGDNLTTGANNILIGYDIDAPAVGSANTLNIGNLIFATGIDGTGTTLSSGKVGIGTTTPTEKFTLVGGSLFQAGGDAVTNYTPTLLGSESIGASLGQGGTNPAIYVSKGYAYTAVASALSGACSTSSAAGCEFRIYDVSTSSPAFVNGMDLGAITNVVFVSGNYAYVGKDNTGISEDFIIYDISNPSSIATTSAMNLSHGVYSINVYGKYAYLGTQASTGNDFKILDISDPRNPIEVGGLDMAGHVEGVYVSGKYAYLSISASANDCTAGTFTGCEFQIADISNPSNPIVVGGRDLGDHATAIHVSGPYAYVGKRNILGVTGSIIIYNITDPTNPATTTTISLGVSESPNSIFVSGRYVYVGYDSISGNDLRVFDVSNPSNAVAVGGIDVGNVRGLFISGRRAYVSAGNNFSIYDLSGTETQSLLAHSFESGQASVRDNLLVGQGIYSSSLNVGLGGIQSLGELSVNAASTTSAGNTLATFTGGLVGIGTTTPFSSLHIASSTRTLLTITDTAAGANLKHWSLGSMGGNFYLATSSDAYATSSISALTVTANQSLGIGTTSPTESLSTAGRLFVGGTGTSTIQNNLYVQGTLRATVSYVGDLVFSNNFRYVEGFNNAGADTLLLNGPSGNNVFTADGAGNVGLSTTSPATLFEVGGTTNNVTFDGYLNCAGFTSNANGLLACTASDERLKQDITPLPTESGLAAISALRPVSFSWKPGADRGRQQQHGFIAQEVQTIFPNLVTTTNPTLLTPDGTLSLNYEGLISPMVLAIQELNQKIDSHASSTAITLTSLESRLALLESGAVSSSSGTPSISTSTVTDALEGLGVLLRSGVAQFNTLVLRQLVVSTDADGTSSAGSVTIPAGNVVALVDNALVSPSTKIFVTFTAEVDGNWWVSDKVAGSFRVVLSAPQTTDVSFDYFLVQTEGQLDTSLQLTADSGQESSSPTPNPDSEASLPSEPETPPAPSNPQPASSPVVTLIGDAAMQMTVGDSFTDPGATATDDTDGDLTAHIVITGSVDTGTEGLSTLTYSATDAAGNTGSVSRVVTIVPASTADSAPPADSSSGAPESPAPSE